MPTQVTNYQCPACTGPLHYSAKSGKLECDYCDSSFDVAEIEALYARKEAEAAAAKQAADAKAEAAQAAKAEAAEAAAASGGWDTSDLSRDWGAEADGLRVLHMGDLGHMLSPEQLAALGCVDVLMIPVGGFYTIDARQAAELAKKIAPAVTVPMHYRGDGFGYDVIAPIGDFLRLMDNVVMLDGNVIEPEKLDAPVIAVPKCPRG